MEAVLSQNKPVVIERVLGGIGDCVMVRPSINAYIKQNPDREVYIRTSRPLDDIFCDIQHAKILLDTPDFSSFEHYDLNSPCLDYELNNHPFAVVNHRNMVKRDRNIELSRQEIFCNKLGVDFDIANYDVRFTEEEQDFAETFTRGLSNILLVHCNSNEVSRTYKYEAALLDYLSKYWEGYIIAIRPKTYSSCSNVIIWNEGSLRSLWAVMSKATAFIGVDSGPIHMAGSIGVPVYGIFGPTDPAIRLKYKHAYWKPIKCKYTKDRPCWYTPCKGAYCMSRYPKEIFEDFTKAINGEERCIKRGLLSRRSNIGIVLLEGLGGTVTVSDYAKKIYDLSGSKSDIIIRKYHKLFDKNPYINDIVEVGSIWYNDCDDLYRSKYSYLVIVKTALGRWNNLSLTGFRDDKLFSLFDELPNGMNKLEIYDRNLVEMANYSLGLPDNSDDVMVYSDSKYTNIPNQSFIVISNGVDSDHKGKRLTKCWDYWGDFVHGVGVMVVQVGTLFDDKVDGVIDLRGKTSIKQLLYVIKKAKAVVCSEGGLMHLSKAAKQPNTFVLRGPTRGSIFNYKSQINIDSTVCDPCYFSRKGWDEYCISGKYCMGCIKPDKVINTVLSII